MFQIKRKFRENNRLCVIKLCVIYDQLFQFVFFFFKLVNVSRFGLDFSADLFYCLLEDLKYFTVAKPSILENTPSILLKQINHYI